MSWLNSIARRIFAKAGNARLIFPGSPWGPAADWQIGAPVIPYSRAETNASVHACMTIISSEFSRAVPFHNTARRGGGFERDEGSAIARVLVRPERSQTAVTFWAYLVRWLLADGNAYAIASRNARDEIDELNAVPSTSCAPVIDPESGEVFYQVNGDPMRARAPARRLAARDVLHLRINALAHPMVATRDPASAGRSCKAMS
jgi:phage portal protein BeeE